MKNSFGTPITYRIGEKQIIWNCHNEMRLVTLTNVEFRLWEQKRRQYCEVDLRSRGALRCLE